MSLVTRTSHNIIKELAKSYPALVVTGPRQSGKTTLVQEVFSSKPYVSLEDLDNRDYAHNDPRSFLNQYSEGAILDEVQLCPDLFSYLQTKLDTEKKMGLFILTGSQQFGLMSGISQSLAGRVAKISLLPFSLNELSNAKKAPKTIEDIMFNGMYPPIYDRKLDPNIWYNNYIETYIERDVRQLINVRDLRTFHTFLRMCAARSAQILNLSGLASDCGINHNTAKAWISVLEASYIIHLLEPYCNNFNKRLIKAPKLYFYDTGLACRLQNIESAKQLEIHSARGHLFETWVVSELLKKRFNKALLSNLYFWRDRSGNEVDTLIDRGGKVSPVEIKSGKTINDDFFKGITKFTSIAGETAVDPVLIYGGDVPQNRNNIKVIPWKEVASLSN